MRKTGVQNKICSYTADKLIIEFSFYVFIFMEVCFQKYDIVFSIGGVRFVSEKIVQFGPVLIVNLALKQLVS